MFDRSLKLGEPLGLRQGLTVADLGEDAEFVETTSSGDSYFVLPSVPAGHPDFINYTVAIAENSGLSKVLASIIQGSFLDDPDAVDTVFAEWTQRLDAIFGSRPADATMVKGVNKIDATRVVAWSRDTGADLPTPLCRVVLYSTVLEEVFEGAFDVGEIPSVVLFFSFENSRNCK